jgi:hypothetical protein
MAHDPIGVNRTSLVGSSTAAAENRSTARRREKIGDPLPLPPTPMHSKEIFAGLEEALHLSDKIAQSLTMAENPRPRLPLAARSA